MLTTVSRKCMLRPSHQILKFCQFLLSENVEIRTNKKRLHKFPQYLVALLLNRLRFVLLHIPLQFASQFLPKKFKLFSLSQFVTS